MQLEFGPDDEDRFFAVRDDLLERFERWLNGHDLPSDLRADAELILGFKWGYLDGHLGRWQRFDLDEILLELYPRKVLADEELAALTIPAMAALLTFLSEEGLLTRDSEPLDLLLDRIEELQEPYHLAISDHGRFGPSKSLLDAMLADGVALEDAGAVDAWIEAFNAGTREDRDAVLGPAMPQMSMAMEGRRRLRPVTFASPEVLEEAARTAPAMVRFQRFIAYVTTPRKLTDKGNLKLADARELVELLDLDDRLDEQIGDETFRTRSSTELTTLDLTYRWARAAGLVKVRKGEVSATKAGREAAEEALPATERALHGILELGVLRHFYTKDPYGFGWYAEDVDAELPIWLLELYQHDHLDIEELAAETWELLLDRFDLGDVPASKLDFHRSLVESGVRRILERLEELGIVTVGDLVEEETLVGSREAGGSVALTDLGVWAVQRMASLYLDAPVVGMLVEATADELLRQVTDVAEDAARAELDAWVAHRPAAEAVAELVEAMSDADDVGVALAFGALLRLGEPAVPAMRELRGHPRLGAIATVWLVDTLQLDEEEVRVDDAHGQADLLHAVLELRGPHAVTAWLPLLLGVSSDTGRDVIATAVGELWRVRTNEAGEVLDAVASTHPDKVVAKAARKALFKLRSAGT